VAAGGGWPPPVEGPHARARRGAATFQQLAGEVRRAN
jgi:hypothetical protein